ncbi:MAG: hypothetical protein Q8K85_03345, partial [Hyphomicrobium sp.]|nr:hypothetical protein [Hyphomicrobium sp.]
SLTSAAGKFSGHVRLSLVDPATHLWSVSAVLSVYGSDYRVAVCGGEKALSAALTQVRIQGNGSTFDGGVIRASSRV